MKILRHDYAVRVSDKGDMDTQNPFPEPSKGSYGQDMDYHNSLHGV